jgi:microcystin-dependent protein
MDGYLGQICLFAGDYAPQGWALCDGALTQVSDNPALYSLIGNHFGGNPPITFALPDLRGRVPVHAGQGSPPIGMAMGSETVTLSVAQLPPHSHSMQASATPANDVNPAGRIAASTQGNFYAPFDASKKAEFLESAVLQEGGSQPHTNLMPYLAINFIICVSGTYPQQP